MEYGVPSVARSVVWGGSGWAGVALGGEGGKGGRGGLQGHRIGFYRATQGIPRGGLEYF